MITGKTIGQLTQLDTMTPDTLIPVEFSGSTYYVSHSILTSSSSFSNRISGLEIASGSFSTRVSDLKTDSGSFSTRVSEQETASGSFSTRVTNLISDSGSFSTRVSDLKTDSGSFSTRNAALETASGSFSTRVTNLVTDSGSFSTRISNLVSDSGSFSTRSTALETASGSFSTRVTNLVSDSSSFSNRITYFTGSVFGTSSKVVNGVYTTDTGSVSNNMLAGSISNSKLINSSILIGSSSVSLGATASSFTGLDSVSANSITVAGQPTTYGVVNPAYIVVGLVNSVTLFGASQTFVLDTVLSNTNSQVSYNTSSGVFTLTAGVTYDMSFTPSFIAFSNTTGGFLCYQWVDATTNTPLDSTGTGVGTALPSTETGGQVDNLTARIIYTPSTNKTVKLYTTSVNGTATLRGGIGTQVIIKPMNLSVAVQATATGTVAATVVTDTNVVGTSVNGGSSTSPGLTILTLAIPSAGTWRLDAELRVYVPGAGYMAAAFYDNGTLIPNSEYFVAAGGVTQSGAATGQYSGFMSYNLTTTSARTVTVGIWTTTSANCIASEDGRTWARATKLDSIFALNALDTMTLTGAISASGNITGNTLISSVASGNEGGEIQLAKSPNSTLSGSNVVIDQYIDRIRIFEAGGSSRGAYIDLTQAAGGVGTLLNNRVSGFVNAGTFVTMDLIKATVTTGGQRGLSLATTTGTLTYNIGGTFGGASVGSGGSGASNQSLTTTDTTSIFGWGFNATGDTSTYILNDLTNSKAYRITLQIATSFNSNMISIERLV